MKESTTALLVIYLKSKSLGCFPLCQSVCKSSSFTDQAAAVAAAIADVATTAAVAVAAVAVTAAAAPDAAGL